MAGPCPNLCQQWNSVQLVPDHSCCFMMWINNQPSPTVAADPAAAWSVCGVRRWTASHGPGSHWRRTLTGRSAEWWGRTLAATGRTADCKMLPTPTGLQLRRCVRPVRGRTWQRWPLSPARAYASVIMVNLYSVSYKTVNVKMRISRSVK